MKALRVVNPAILKDPRFKEIAKEAVAVSFGQYDEVPERWVLDQENNGVFIAYEGKEINGLMTIMLGTIPQVVLFTARSPEAKRALIRIGVDFLKDLGYTRFMAVNTSGAADSVWKRAFWRKGEAVKVGTIMEFAL